jgi:hypothetical protein
MTAVLYAIAVDHSSWNPALDHTYNRGFNIMRATQGTYYKDPKWAVNAEQAHDLYWAGEIVGAIAYHVYTNEDPAAQFRALWAQIGSWRNYGPNRVPEWLLGIMHDVETWRGTSYALAGNHSSKINKLIGLNAAKMKSWNACPWYGNQPDLAELYPTRDARTWGVVAAYTSSIVISKVKGARAQQYTDGQLKWPVPVVNGKPLPRSSPPFGRADHNYFPNFTPAKLRAFMRPDLPVARQPKPPPKPKPTPAPKPTPGGKVPYYKPRQDALVSADGKFAVFLRSDGRMDLRKQGHHVAWVDLTKTVPAVPPKK